MAEHALSGIWLLLDAAGPDNLIGLIKDGEWMCKAGEQGEFLEVLHPAAKHMLEKEKLRLEDLSGSIYASGPGSTLGLRLAAMFIRTLLEMPLLAHWRCLQYQNLELALCSLQRSATTQPLEAVAPWRRDRFHHVVMQPRSPVSFKHHYIAPQDAVGRTLAAFTLGRRPPADSLELEWTPFPAYAVPAVLKTHPELLRQTECPVPYTAEEPDFMRWSTQRHTGQ